MFNFDKLYDQEQSPWGKVPDLLIEQAAERMAGRTVLDLGCGDGRNALYLAECGFNVTAIDSSCSAIDQLMQNLDEKII